jgi:heterodisulfide reductase subunit C
MTKLSAILSEDIRFREGLTACMNCGACTAICPSAEFYNYDPQQICKLVQSKNDEAIEELLKSETIWYCGECMSCKARCPRGNTPGLVIMVLRKLSQQLGYFTESEKGRQQFAIRKTTGQSILDIGYCVHPDSVHPETHLEQGPVWKWYRDNIRDIAPKLGANYHGDGPGALKTSSQEDLDEIKKIFEATGAMKHFERIDHFSNKEKGNQNEEAYINTIYTCNSGSHGKTPNPLKGA